MTLKDRIAHYLARGLKPADVAEVCGCSAGYISQLLKDDSYRASVEALMQEAPPEEEDSLKAKYTGLEHKIVAAMSIAVDGAELPHLTRAMDSVTRANEARHKRTNPLNGFQGNVQNLQIVSVMLPQHALSAPKTLTLNAQSEVVAIGDKALAPLSSTGVRELFTKLQDKPKEAIEGEANVTITREAQMGTKEAADF